MKFFAILVLALAAARALAYDPSPLQDICVAINSTEKAVFVNGKFCKDPKLSNAEDFVFRGFRTPSNTDNQLGFSFTPAVVDQFPGVNTLGISNVGLDYAPGGLNPPHTHPRGTEILFVKEGTLYAGFVTSDQLNNRLFTTILYPGDVFVIPIGLIHFQLNVGKTNAVAIAGFNSQKPGVITVANAVFGAHPPINVDVLTKGFQLDADTVKHLQELFGSNN